MNETTAQFNYRMAKKIRDSNMKGSEDIFWTKVIKGSKKFLESYKKG